MAHTPTQAQWKSVNYRGRLFLISFIKEADEHASASFIFSVLSIVGTTFAKGEMVSSPNGADDIPLLSQWIKNAAENVSFSAVFFCE